MPTPNTKRPDSMRRFSFTYANRTARLTAEQAQKFLNVTKRTIQNYYHPKKRQAHAWRLLEAHALGHLFPPELGIWYDESTDQIKTDTGFTFEPHELTQARHWATVQANTIQQLKIENSKLKAAIKATEPEPKSQRNIVDFQQFKTNKSQNHD